MTFDQNVCTNPVRSRITPRHKRGVSRSEGTMNRRGLFAGLAAAMAVPVAAVLPKADAAILTEELKAKLAQFEKAFGNVRFLTADEEADLMARAVWVGLETRAVGDRGPEIIAPAA